MKRNLYLSVIIITVIIVSLTACGMDTSNNFASADDAEQNIAKLEEEQESSDVNNSDTTTEYRDQDADWNDEEAEKDSAESDQTAEVMGESAENPELYDEGPDYDEGSELKYYDGDEIRPCYDADPGAFWIDESTYDLESFCKACGGVFSCWISEGDNVMLDKSYNDPNNDTTPGIAIRYTFDINSMYVEINTEAIDNNALSVHNSGLYIGDSYGNFVTAWGTADFTPIHILGYDQNVTKGDLEKFFIVVRRVIHHDNKCLLRGLNMPHEYNVDENIHTD